jgi:hypothetical protein
MNMDPSPVKERETPKRLSGDDVAQGVPARSFADHFRRW